MGCLKKCKKCKTKSKKSECTSDSSCKDKCTDCKCDKKPNSETVRDDGVFCRKCNVFMSKAVPDGSDGKATCYCCKNPLF